MIYTIVRNGFIALRRDRGALILSFILPIAFFTIFGLVFGGDRASGIPRIGVLIVDQDRSPLSSRMIGGLRHEPSLLIATHPDVPPGAKEGSPAPADYTAASAEAAVRRGIAPVALIIPPGFGADRKGVNILQDSSNPFAAQIAAGMLQKVAMTPSQRDNAGAMIPLTIRDVVGEKKRSPMISFYAAGVGVMFLLFTASAAGGSLLDEAESGALDRILSARVGMTTLLIGKMCYASLLAFSQMIVMFLWSSAVFHVELFSHLPGFLVMTAATSFAVASFGMVLASVARTRAQLASFSTLIILTMSAVGGSMFPPYIMPEMMRKIGLFTFNSWAIEGYTKVFWRDQSVSQLAPQLAVLVCSGIVLFSIARLFARRWECT